MTRKTSPAVPPAPEAASADAPNRMWGGRFDASPDAVMEAINASIDFDRRLYAEDIAGSVAHVTMLAKQGIVTQEDADAITQGLHRVREEIEAGGFPFDRALEDIHMNVEARLAALIGPAAGRLHTARSPQRPGGDRLAALAPRASGRGRRRLPRPSGRAHRPGGGARGDRHGRASPTCRWRSRSPSATTCSPTSR